MNITKDTTIEELVDGLPEAVKFLRKEGIRCLACGEPVWGTLGEAAREKGLGDSDIERVVAGLNALTRQAQRD